MYKIINLNGQWDFVADLDPKYHNDPREYPEPSYAKPDADRRHWMKVPVPGVWQNYAQRYDIYEGVCWFAREFEIEDGDEDATARLRFGAVNYFCKIFLNGEEIGRHETGYTEFVITASGHLKAGQNHIAVMVDNRATITKWPPCLGYFNYGGIHRDVSLEIIKGRCIDKVSLTASIDGNDGILTTEGSILSSRQMQDEYAGSEPLGLKVEVRCDGLINIADVDLNGNFQVKLRVCDIQLWSPEMPHLHDVTVVLLQEGGISDTFKQAYGFKTIEMIEGKIYLNRKPTKLKGICYVYDSPITGLVMTDEQIETDIALMKELGCNTVRCHYPMDEKFYEACDRAGIMVWIEPNIYCYHPVDNARNTAYSDIQYRALAEEMITGMIHTSRNHPSVSIYGIGNECNTVNSEAGSFFKGLMELIRLEDTSRLVSYAALYGIVGPIADLVDVLGINSYWGWYDKIFGGKGLKPKDNEWKKESSLRIEPIDLSPMRQMIDKIIVEAHKNMALLLTEFGADSVAGFYSKSRDLWSENYHSDLLEEIFKLSEEFPQIVGTFPFCFSDYRDPSKVPNGYWNELNLKGVVTYDRRKRLAFDKVKNYYTSE